MLKKTLKLLHEPIYNRRLDVLVDIIIARLVENDRILDVGCGGGALGSHILEQATCPPGITIEGLENHPRGGEPITVHAYDGHGFPFPDESFDYVLLADVLHHEPDCLALLREAGRVARKGVMIKDHKVDGFLAYPRICFLDWAANIPYGVKCLYDYQRYQQWEILISEAGLSKEDEINSIDLYPFVFNLIFGKKLQYFCVCRKEQAREGR